MATHIWAHRGPPASPNPHAACPGPGGWGTPRGTQPLGCPSAIPNTPGRGQGFTPWSVCPPHMSSATSASPRGAAHPQTPPGAGHTHRQLLVGGHLVRQGPDPLIGAVHPQPGAQPRQLLIAPRVVPARGEEATGSTGHCWAWPWPWARPPPAPHTEARDTHQWWWVVRTARSTTSSLLTISSSWKGPGAAGGEGRRWRAPDTAHPTPTPHTQQPLSEHPAQHRIGPTPTPLCKLGAQGEERHPKKPRTARGGLAGV